MQRSGFLTAGQKCMGLKGQALISQPTIFLLNIALAVI
jgi:ABC-type branched-subunit amino acid transport system ATPase component